MARQPARLGRQACRVAAPVDQILHAVYQNIANGFVDLRRLLDLVILVRLLPPARWTQVLQLATEGMLDRGFGRVISISSINGQKGQFGQANYAASKAGIHGFTMSLAQEGARKGVTANTVSPGYIESPMVNAVPEDIRNQIIAQIPRNRLGRPADIARTVVFLAADDADFITGANIPVNGGHYMS